MDRPLVKLPMREMLCVARETPDYDPRLWQLK